MGAEEIEGQEGGLKQAAKQRRVNPGTKVAVFLGTLVMS